MSEIPRKSSARTAKLASIPLGMAGRAAMGFGRKLAGGDKGEIDAQLSAKAAEQLFAVLGELKGGAMKLGQALSVMEAAIPEEFAEPYRESLNKLQAAAPPLPTKQVHKMLDQQLGTKWRDRFQSFDDEPTASASIGQVHRAVWADGRDVAVKVQYPGADEALRADLKTLGRFAGLFGSVMPGVDVRPVIEEFTARTEEELDYRIEANNQRAFAKEFDGDPQFVIPHVVASAPKVVVTEWMTATPVDQNHRKWNAGAAQCCRCTTRRIPLRVSGPCRLAPLRPAPRQFHASRGRPTRRHRLRCCCAVPERTATGSRHDGALGCRGTIRRIDGVVARQRFRDSRTHGDRQGDRGLPATLHRPDPDRVISLHSVVAAKGRRNRH
ncbi:hypothetical protein M2260_004825 [Rhodococcus erythropolis]|nr:hypothetical protein [Rhodococcus erythropolis]